MHKPVSDGQARVSRPRVCVHVLETITPHFESQFLSVLFCIVWSIPDPLHSMTVEKTILGSASMETIIYHQTMRSPPEGFLRRVGAYGRQYSNVGEYVS